MTKFGELISVEQPVLIDFFFDWGEVDDNSDTLRDVAAALGDKAKVIKILQGLKLLSLVIFKPSENLIENSQSP